MKGTTFKRCSCRDPHSGRRLGRTCPQLRRPGGGWSRSHGGWHAQIELPPRADGSRRTLHLDITPTELPTASARAWSARSTVPAAVVTWKSRGTIAT